MEARARTASRSLAERRLAWADICGKVQYDGLADTAASQDLCRVVFATLRDYHDKPSQRAVERAIAESKLSPAHNNLQEWSVLAAFLAEQPLAIDVVRTSGDSQPTSRRCPGARATCWTGRRTTSRTSLWDRFRSAPSITSAAGTGSALESTQGWSLRHVVTR